MLKMTREQVQELLKNKLTNPPKDKLDEALEAVTSQVQGALLRPTCKKGKECCGRCLEQKREKACTTERLERHVTPLREAIQVDQAKGEIRAIVLTEGPGNAVDRNYYSKRAVEDLVSKINGIKCYINHQTEAERKERGEGDIWGLAGYWKDATLETVDDAGVQKLACAATLRCDKSVAGREAFAKAVAAVQHRQEFPDSGEVYCGLSINKDGMQTGTVESNGEEYRGRGPAYANITAFAPEGSTDLVTRPARGGQFTKLVESAKGGFNISQSEEREMKIKDVIKKHLAESLKKTLEQAGDDDKTAKAKAELVDSAVANAISNLPAATAEMDDATPAPKAGEEMDPAATADTDTAEMEPGVSPEILEQLKKDVMPMVEGESDDDYMGRVGKAMSLMGGGTQEADGFPPEKEKKGEESAKTGEPIKALEAFRKSNPEQFAKLLEGARIKLDVERKDFRGLREQLREKDSKLRESEAKLLIVSDLQEGKKLLDDCDVQIPIEMLCEADMVGMSTEQKEREVGKYVAIVEGARLGAGMPRTVSGGSPKSAVNLDGLKIKLKDK